MTAVTSFILQAICSLHLLQITVNKIRIIYKATRLGLILRTHGISEAILVASNGFYNQSNDQWRRGTNVLGGGGGGQGQYFSSKPKIYSDKPKKFPDDKI